MSIRNVFSPGLLFAFFFTVACGVSGPPDETKETGFGLATSMRTLKTVEGAGSVTYNHIFSAVQDAAIEGEGFFVDFGDGNAIFVASHFTDNPHDIANTQRKFQAILKGVNEVSYAATEPLEVYVESKEALGAEHMLLSVDAYKALAQQVRELGHARTINLVDYKDLTFKFDTVRFPCAAIEGFASTTTTTGGSVHLFTVLFSDETDDLSIVAATAEADSLDRLAEAKAQIEACKGSDRTIVATELAYQDQIFTFDGIRSGWTTFVSQIRVE